MPYAEIKKTLIDLMKGDVIHEARYEAWNRRIKTILVVVILVIGLIFTLLNDQGKPHTWLVFLSAATLALLWSIPIFKIKNLFWRWIWLLLYMTIGVFYFVNITQVVMWTGGQWWVVGAFFFSYLGFPLIEIIRDFYARRAAAEAKESCPGDRCCTHQASSV